MEKFEVGCLYWGTKAETKECPLVEDDGKVWLVVAISEDRSGVKIINLGGNVFDAKWFCMFENAGGSETIDLRHTTKHDFYITSDAYIGKLDPREDLKNEIGF